MNNAFFNSLGDIVTFVSSIGLPVSLVLLAIFIRWRTGSYLTVFSRLWTIFHGKTPAASLPIKEYLEAQTSVSRLRFQTGAKVRTEEHARRLLEWSAANNESLTDAAACGPYFDFELPGLKDRSTLPGPLQKTFYALGFVSLLVAFWLMMILVAYDKPLLRIKSTGTWVAFTAESAEPFLGSGKLALTQCGAAGTVPKSSGPFAAADVTVICSIARSRTPAQLRQDMGVTLREQKASALAAALSCVLLTYPLIRMGIFIDNANSMRRRLSARPPTTRAQNDTGDAPTSIRQVS